MIENPLEYEIAKKETLYKGVFRLVRLHLRHQLFGGGISEVFTREVFERPAAAAILPYDPFLDRVILIKQFRAGGINKDEPWMLEIPAGMLDPNESTENLAKRELTEETGCEAIELCKICGFFVSPGGSDEYLTVFCGKVDAANVSGIFGIKEDHEDILVVNVSVEEALEKLNRGEIKTGPAIIGLLWLQLNKEKIKKEWVK